MTTHVEERPGAAHELGEQLTVVGRPLYVGGTAPDFVLERLDPSSGATQTVHLADTAGRVRLLNLVNSLDTPVCDVETRRWDALARGVARRRTYLDHQHGPSLRPGSLVRRCWCWPPGTLGAQRRGLRPRLRRAYKGVAPAAAGGFRRRSSGTSDVCRVHRGSDVRAKLRRGDGGRPLRGSLTPAPERGNVSGKTRLARPANHSVSILSTSPKSAGVPVRQRSTPLTPGRLLVARCPFARIEVEQNTVYG